MAIVIRTLLGSFMDRVDDTIQKAVDEAKNAAIAVELEAGRQISLAIQNAENAYKEVLDYTVDKVNEAIQADLRKLEDMVKQFQDRNAELMSDLADRATLLSMQLPFHDRHPQLWKLHPSYISTKVNDFVLSFKGKFEDAADKSLVPELSFPSKSGPIKALMIRPKTEQHVKPIGLSGDNAYQPPLTKSTTLQLDFIVDLSKLFPKDLTSNYPHCVGTLQVPWVYNSFLYWASGGYLGWDTSIYKVCIGALPINPGDITIQYSGSTPEVQPVSRNFETHSNVDRHGTWHDVQSKPDAGWHVVRGTTNLVFDKAFDQYDRQFRSDDGDLVWWKVWNHHHGWTKGRVLFNQTRDVAVTKEETKTAPEWGSNIVVAPPAGLTISKVIFKAFDGTSNEFVPGMVFHSPYLEMEFIGKQLNIRSVTHIKEDVFTSRVKLLDPANIAFKFDK